LSGGVFDTIEKWRESFEAETQGGLRQETGRKEVSSGKYARKIAGGLTGERAFLRGFD